MTNVTRNHIAGARNLLLNCANLQTGETLLVISERADLGWYDGKTAKYITQLAKEMGIKTSLIEVGRPENVRCPQLSRQIENHDCTIFFSRIGDQDRFSHPKAGTRSVMSYIRDMDMLASKFCTTDYNAIRALKNAIDDILFNAHSVEITCSLGTHLTNNTPYKDNRKADVGVLRFPLGVHAPMTATNLSGTLAMDRYLAPTGSRIYEPPCLKLDTSIIAKVEMGRIVDFTGPKVTVKKVKEHYSHVASQFDIDAAVIHSWHAGIHPGCAYDVPESEDPDRWSNTVFSMPKYVHFHTCGDYAPGEISCTNENHTIKINDIILWKDGKLFPYVFEKTKACLDNRQELNDLFGYSAA